MTWTRVTAACASGAVVIAGLSARPSASGLGTATPAAEIGADWLESKLIDDLLVKGDPSAFESVDASMDATIAFAQIAGHEIQGQETLLAVEQYIPNYVLETFPDGNGGSVGEMNYVGRIAKAAALALRNSRDLDTFAGGQLLNRLQSQVANNEPIEGRAFDKPVDTVPGDDVDFLEDGRSDDKANVIDQAWAVEALKRASDGLDLDDPLRGEADKATAFLFRQQCAQGYFRESFYQFKIGAETDQNCSVPLNPSISGANNRTTAQVALILQLLIKDGLALPGSQIANSLPAAVDWLLDKQADNGSLREIAGAEPDAYTTGLAGLVFAASNHPTEARKAAQWLRELQAFDPEECIANNLTFDTGAIAPTKPIYNEGKIFGIVPSSAGGRARR